MPLEQSVSDTNIWSITLELLITLLVLSFDNQNMFKVQSVAPFKAFSA